MNYQAGYVACRKAAESGVDLKTHPVGTGPFKFGSYQSRDKLILLRNNSWWGGKPTVDQLTFQFMYGCADSQSETFSGRVS